MNAHTEAMLEYAHIQRELQSYTVTPMGKALVAQLHPSTDLTQLVTQQDETSEMVALLALGGEPPLAPVLDLQPHLVTGQIAGWYLEGIQLLEVAECLEVIQRLRRYAQDMLLPAPLLSRRLARLTDFGILLRQIRSALDDKGYVRDHASPGLQEIRQTLARLRDRIQRTLRELMATYGTVVQDAVVTIRNDRFVIPLKTDFRQALRGIVHGESASGATVYVEPDNVIDLNNQLLHSRAAEERAIREVLQQLTERLSVQSVALQQALQIVGEIDFLVAKGRLSQRMQGIAPQLTSEPCLHLLQARHPLLSTPVPVDVHLGPDDKALVITGPNTGGKTAVLKTVGLLALMAQSGLHISAGMGSRLPLFTDIFIDLGDEQSLQQNLSTFSAHLANIRAMMSQVSAGSLILLDELGAGTDPMEGGPLGAAILEYFHEHGAMTLATTHHSTIKAFAISTPGIACAAVDFDLETLQPRYRLVYGLPGRSKAFAIAQKLGLPERVILRAQQEAGAVQLRNEQLLSRLEIARQAVDDEQQSLNQKRAEIERAHTEARQKLAHATTEEQRIRQALSAEGHALLKAVRQELDGTLAALRKQLPPESAIVFPHEAWQQAVQAITSLAPTPVAVTVSPPLCEVGDWVRVRGRNIRGRLRTPVAGHHTVQVEVGTKTITVASSEVERSDEHDTGLSQTSSHRSPKVRRQQQPATMQIPGELHLLGYTVDEALPVVDKHIDQAFTQGVSSVRIVHGVGSGRLRESIRDFLGNHPLVRRFHASDLGGGITIVELEG